MNNNISYPNTTVQPKNSRLSIISFIAGILPIVLNLSVIALLIFLVVFSITIQTGLEGSGPGTAIFLVLAAITTISPIVSIVTGIKAIKADKLHSGLANIGIVFAIINLSVMLLLAIFVFTFPRFG